MFDTSVSKTGFVQSLSSKATASPCHAGAAAYATVIVNAAWYGSLREGTHGARVVAQIIGIYHKLL